MAGGKKDDNAAGFVLILVCVILWGIYVAVSELKTEVFGIMQAFNRHIPAEEQLRRYDEVRNQNSSEQQQKKVENGLVELVSRYWVLTQGDMK